MNKPCVRSTLVASQVDQRELSKQRLPSLVLPEDDLNNSSWYDLPPKKWKLRQWMKGQENLWFCLFWSMKDNVCLLGCVSCSRRHEGEVGVENTQDWGLMELWGWMDSPFGLQPPHNTLLRMVMTMMNWFWMKLTQKLPLSEGWNKAI